MTETGDRLREAEQFLHEKIPLTRAMGVRVVPHGDLLFAVEAPVAFNHNHLHTAFGGSINAVATLAGYTFLWLELRDRSIEIVVAESAIRFRSPIRENIRAVCEQPAAEALVSVNAALAEKGKARIALRVRVEERATLAAEFNGTFVAFRNAHA